MSNFLKTYGYVEVNTEDYDRVYTQAIESRTAWLKKMRKKFDEDTVSSGPYRGLSILGFVILKGKPWTQEMLDRRYTKKRAGIFSPEQTHQLDAQYWLDIGHHLHQLPVDKVVVNVVLYKQLLSWCER
jgi:hypothetical protein